MKWRVAADADVDRTAAVTQHSLLLMQFNQQKREQKLQASALRCSDQFLA